VAVEVGPQAEHDQAGAGQGGQRGDERLTLGLAGRRERLLELIHDDRGGILAPVDQFGIAAGRLPERLGG
jgi:hypothetical protein